MQSSAKSQQIISKNPHISRFHSSCLTPIKPSRKYRKFQQFHYTLIGIALFLAYLPLFCISITRQRLPQICKKNYVKRQKNKLLQGIEKKPPQRTRETPCFESYTCQQLLPGAIIYLSTLSQRTTQIGNDFFESNTHHKRRRTWTVNTKTHSHLTL